MVNEGGKVKKSGILCYELVMVNNLYGSVKVFVEIFLFFLYAKGNPLD